MQDVHDLHDHFNEKNLINKWYENGDSKKIPVSTFEDMLLALNMKFIILFTYALHKSNYISDTFSYDFQFQVSREFVCTQKSIHLIFILNFHVHLHIVKHQLGKGLIINRRNLKKMEKLPSPMNCYLYTLPHLSLVEEEGKAGKQILRSY